MATPTDSQQGRRHESARASISPQESTHDDDLHAFFQANATVPPGATYNEAFILWLQSVTGITTTDNVNDLAQAFAESTGAYNWSSTGELGEGAFPPTLPGLEFWFDAQDASTITTDAFGVTNWADKSGNGRDLGQTNDPRKPDSTTDGGQPAIFFDGVNHVLFRDPVSISFTGSTFFMAFRRDGATTGTDTYFIARDVGDVAALQLTENSAGNFQYVGFTSAGSTNSLSLPNPKGNTRAAAIARGENAQPDGLLRFDDGSQATDVSIGTLRTIAEEITLGGADGVVGGGTIQAYIHELGFYSQSLSDTDFNDLMAYLVAKWGIV